MTNWRPTRRTLVQSVLAIIGFESKIGELRTNTNSDTEEWPLGHHDKRRTGSSDRLEAPGMQLKKTWSRNIGETPRDIRIVNGTVFANGYALNAETGEGIWSGSMNTFHDGKIYAERDGNLCQVDPSSGDIDWSLSIEGNIDNIIGWEDSIILDVTVASSSTGKIYSISLKNQQQEWVKDRVSPGGFAAADGCLYFVDYSGSYPSLHSVNIDDGNTNYNTETSSINVGRPTVHENTVYLSDSYGDLIAFGASLGTKKWKFNTTTDGYGSPAVTNEYVICPLGDKVVCLTHNMGKNWEFQVEQGWGSYGQGGVSVVNDKVYFGTYGGIFYILDLQSGEELNSLEINSEIRSSPAIGYNKVFFGTEDETLYVLTDQPNREPDPAFSYSPQAPRVDTEVTFDASKSTDDQSIEEYNWKFENSNVASDTGKIASKIFKTPGTKLVKLTVTDDQDASATSSKSVEVVRENQVPVTIISHSPEEPEVGEVVTFEGTASSDPDGTIETYEWK